MKHNDISKICRQVIANTLGILEDEVEIVPWDGIIYPFAAEHVSIGDLNKQQIRDEFQEIVDKWISGQRNTVEFSSSAMQRHHDYYVHLFRQKGENLHPHDKVSYDMAMQREKEGFVKPLEE